MAWHKSSFKNIYVRMFLVICVAVIPSFAGLCFYVYQQRNYLTDYSTENAQRFVQLAAHDESWLFSSTQDLFTAISHMPLIRGRNWALCHRFMKSLLTEKTGYNDIGLMSVSGDSLCSGLRAPDEINPVNFADRDYFQRALKEEGLVVSEFHMGRISHKPVILVATALRTPERKPWAVLYASLDVTEMVQARHEALHSDGSFITILDRNGGVLKSMPPQEALGVGDKPQDPKLLSLLSAGRKAANTPKRDVGSEWLSSHKINR